MVVRKITEDIIGKSEEHAPARKFPGFLSVNGADVIKLVDQWIVSSAEFRETVLEYPRYFGKKNGENDQFYVTEIFIGNPLLPFVATIL